MQKFENVAVDSVQYSTAGSQALRSMILRRVLVSICVVWLRTVWYCAELDSAQYDSARCLTPCSIILHGTPEKYEYLGKNETKNETILTHWSEAQVVSNDEKNRGSKILLDCPYRGEIDLLKRRDEKKISLLIINSAEGKWGLET